MDSWLKGTAIAVPDHFALYLSALPVASTVSETLEQQCAVVVSGLASLSLQQQQFVPAVGKWSVAEVIGHLADWERIMGYRAFVYARGIQVRQPWLDERALVKSNGASRRNFVDTLDEWHTCRRANLLLLSGLSDTKLGTMLPYTVTAPFHYPLGMLFAVLAGHVQCHLNVLRCRYGIEL